MGKIEERKRMRKQRRKEKGGLLRLWRGGSYPCFA
jgi:hypothetical protein